MTSYGNLHDTETTEAAMAEYYERRRSVPAVQITHTASCEARHQAKVEYETLWPGYCHTCHGEGFQTWPATWEDPGSSDPCDDCLGQGNCPRCGHHHENEAWNCDTNDLCEACGWDPESGETCPDDECECWDIRSE